MLYNKLSHNNTNLKENNYEKNFIINFINIFFILHG